MEQSGNGNSIRTEMTVTLPHFNDIRKSTVGETYKYFKKLIEGKNIKNLNECMSVSTELSVFDSNLQFMLVDVLHLGNEVLSILLSQNENQIKRVLECKWFFKNLSAEFCTKEIFPFVSLSVRCKIINRLSKCLESTEEAEKYFAFILDNYDRARAEYILPRCSREFILSYVEKTKPTFEQNTGLRVLQNICKRYPEIGILVLSIICDAKGKENYRLFVYVKILRYLAGNHPDLMVRFMKNYNSCIPPEAFCKKLTKKLVGKLGKDLFPEIVKHLIFKENFLFPLLCFEDQVKYICTIVGDTSYKLHRTSWQNSENRIADLLKLVPEDKRHAIIESAFKEVFNLNFNEQAKFWGRYILEVLPTETRVSYVEKIEKFAEEGITVFRKNVGYSNFSTDSPEEFLYLYGASYAFERLKKILQKTPASFKRDFILCQLVKSCRINKDLKTLQEVVEFVATRHRNEDGTVIFHFIEAVYGNFSFSELNSTIFEKLEDLAYFCNLRGHTQEYVSFFLKEIHIYHRLENGLDVDTHVKSLFEFFIHNHYHAFVQNYNKKHSKFLILALCSEAVSWIRNNSTEESRNTAHTLLTKILSTCKCYNESKGSRRIFLRDISGLEEILKEKTKNDFAGVGGEEWPLDVWERYGDGVMNSYYKPACLFYVLKRKPDLIEKHLEDILKMLVCDYFKMYNGFFNFLLRTISFLGKTETAKGIILNEFKSGKSTRNRITALRLYSLMCTIEEFTKAMEDYIPKQDKVERGSAEGFHEIQLAVPTLIKNIKPRWKNFHLLFKFFLGDFLKSVLYSIFSCAYNTRCHEIVPFLKKRLEETPPKVSHVKNIIRLILELSDRKGRMEFCSECWNKHKHYSIRTVVLSYVLHFFLEHRTRESFEFLEKFILDSDEATSHVLPELGNIPDEFLEDYVRTLWRFSETQAQNFTVNFRKNLLQGLTDRNSSLSPEFCESVIKEDLFNPSSEIPMDDFAAEYLVADPNTVERRVGFILGLIKERKPNPRSVYNFLNALITKSLNKPSDFADVFAVMLENWPEYPLGVLYEERVLFTYYNLHQKVVKRCGESPEAPLEFGKELKVLYSAVDNLNELLFIYVENLKRFFTTFPTYDAILALKELVAGSKDKTLAMLAIWSMPSEAVSWQNKKGTVFQNDIVKGKKALAEFVEILEGYGDEIVDIYLRSKFEFVKV